MSPVVPEVSVVIAAFDAESTLGAQLEALAGQEVSFAWEVLVCDNGSRDRTRELVMDWQGRMANLRLVDASARRGPSPARNIGVRAAQGRSVVFCDADDVVAEGWLREMGSALRDAEFVTGSWEGERLNSHHRASVTWTTQSLITKPFLPWLLSTASNNMGVRREVFLEVGGFEETMPTAEDIDLSYRLQLAGHPLVHHPAAVLHVRKRDGLRAVFRQAYSYGAGDRQLRYRYAQVIDAFRALEPTPALSRPSTATAASSPGEPGDGTTVPEASTSTGPEGMNRLGRAGDASRRMLRKAMRVRGRQDLVDRTLRIGRRLGEQLGRVDRTTPQIEVSLANLRSLVDRAPDEKSAEGP